jgi:hypothetical protein
MKFEDFIYWTFLGVVSGGVILTTQILKSINRNLSDMNVKMAIILEKTANHERELQRLDYRLAVVETKLYSKYGVLDGPG